MSHNTPEYYKKHKKQIISVATQWNRDNRDRFNFLQRKLQKKYRQQHPLRKLFQNIKHRCECPTDKKYKYYGGKGIKCLLSMEDLKFLWFRDKAFLMKQPSIDRIDSNKNYCLKNCQFLEMNINRTKRTRINKA